MGHVVKQAMEQVQKQAQVSVPVPVVEAQKTPLAVQPVALDVSAEEYEELEEISELPEPEPVVRPAVKMPAANVAAHAGSELSAPELLDSSQEIFADDSGPQEKVIQFESTAGRTQDVSVPIEVRVGPPGEEVKLQIVFELKIKVLPK